MRILDGDNMTEEELNVNTSDNLNVDQFIQMSPAYKYGEIVTMPVNVKKSVDELNNLFKMDSIIKTSNKEYIASNYPDFFKTDDYEQELSYRIMTHMEIVVLWLYISDYLSDYKKMLDEKDSNNPSAYVYLFLQRMKEYDTRYNI